MTVQFFRLDSSLRDAGSVSRTLADAVEREWRTCAPDAEIVHRDLGRDPLPPVWPAASARFLSPAWTPDDESRQASLLAAALVDELLASDAFVFAVPMYNFGVPQQVKHWIDLIITDPRADDVSAPLLPGRPAILVEARGGGYGPGTPREGWNHATPYLERILRDVWGLELAVVSVELTAARYDPAMASLRDAAEQSLRRGLDAAAETARWAAGQVRPRNLTR